MARVFKQYIPFSFVALALLESAGLFFSVYAGVAIWQTAFTGFVAESLTPLYWKAIVYLLLVNLSLIAMGLYQRRFRYGMAGIILRICSAFFLAAVAISLVFYLIPVLFLDRGPLVVALVIASILVTAVRIGFFKSVDQSILKRRILVLGAGDRASQISKNLRRATDQRGFTIVGYVHVRGEHDVVDENLIIRPDVPLLTLATQLQVDEMNDKISNIFQTIQNQADLINTSQES